MYAQNAISTNEFLGKSWRHTLPGMSKSIGVLVLESRGICIEAKWYWIGLGALFGYMFLFNSFFIVALTYLNPFGKAQAAMSEKTLKEKQANITREMLDASSRGKKTGIHPTSGDDNSRKSASATSRHASFNIDQDKKGMVLPFVPLSITFDDIKYSVDMPQEMKAQGVTDDRLQQLKGVSGTFRPGVLTALMGVSGAGKTTLMDVLTGRKTGGYIDGSININGYPKKQETFARISGYCEQNDIHSPHVTVYESLSFSVWLRLSSDVDLTRRKMFIEEVMELVELTSLRDALVGLPGVSGSSSTDP